ncbi:MAG TPA: hypothetical protein VEQ59_13825 [Polyangiaceae bacterium]|nr:hypothetical protein [Polyangiaceae bacterium]
MSHRSTASLVFILVAAATGGCSRVSNPTPTPEPAPAPALTQSVAAPSASIATAATSASAPPASSTASTPPSDDCAALESGSHQRLSCEAKQEFRAFIADHQSCGAANDCSIIAGACPFGCFVPVAKAKASQVSAKLSELGERLDKAGARCVYRCMAPPAPACVDGRCSSTAAK